MVHASELDLPDFDTTDTTLHGEQFHAVMAELASRSWLARTPLGYATLDRESGEFFLRSRDATFPGQKIAELFAIDDGPLREEIDRNILHIDGDDHRRLRNLLNPFFTPKAADRWRPVMRELLTDLFSGVPGGGCEFVEAFAKSYPALTIARVMGAPREDAPKLHEWSNWIQRQFDGPSLMAERPRIEQAVEEFYVWCRALLVARRVTPGEDLISALIAAEEDGDRLSDVELVNLVLNVLVGGVDTTQSQLAHAIRLFAAAPDQWALLAREPERVPQAVEEVLRHEPITPFTARILTRDVTYRDVEFPADTVIMVCSFTGNRDGESSDSLRHHRGPHHPPDDVRRRHPLLRRRQPGPRRTRGSARVSCSPHARTQTRRRAGIRHDTRDLRPRSATDPLGLTPPDRTGAPTCGAR